MDKALQDSKTPRHKRQQPELSCSTQLDLNRTSIKLKL